MNKEKIKQFKKQKRHARVRAKISGTKDRPRLSVFRSLKHISAQLIDDTQSKTLLSANDLLIVDKTKATKEVPRQIVVAFEVGKLLAKKALEKKITTCVFDKGHYLYHGRVKALADGARENGLKF